MESVQTDHHGTKYSIREQMIRRSFVLFYRSGISGNEETNFRQTVCFYTFRLGHDCVGRKGISSNAYNPFICGHPEKTIPLLTGEDTANANISLMLKTDLT